MRTVLIAGAVAFVIALFGTPVLIRILRRFGIGQEIRTEGPSSHESKRGTPTMGGLIIIAGVWGGYGFAHLLSITEPGRKPTASGYLLLYLFTGLGVVGFLDDFIKVRRRRSLGLSGTAKMVGQLIVAITFGLLSLQFPNFQGATPASTHISFVRDLPWLSVGAIGFVLLAYVIISGTSNAVNLTDGLDGLATGSSVMVFGAFAFIGFQQWRHLCGAQGVNPVACYVVRDGLDVALIAGAAAGACFGFLWWNAAPARIFMGDTGSLSLGGLLAGLAIMTRTEMLLPILGALFVIITLSVIIQVAFFKATRKRVFRMAPLQHHFELAGWQEITIVIRFWIIAGVGVAAGLGVFYADFINRLTHGG
jgi:phospho-N-acetylmuramoyl-pentapeptide-transferase